MIETWWVMDLPIFVARQLIRHRTASVNEVSARYTVLDDRWYLPDPAVVGSVGAGTKQGRTVGDLDPAQRPAAERFVAALDEDCRGSFARYRAAVATGIPTELARLHLHVNHYTRWVWKQDLHNLFHLLNRRVHPHAQWETRQYARAMLMILGQFLPHLVGKFREMHHVDET